MARPGSKPNPTFFWQGLLILLPVGLLAALGFFFVRQDKLIAEHEAVRRAQGIAEDLLPKLHAALTDTNGATEDLLVRFEVDAEGRLLNPPLRSSTPVPAVIDPAVLTRDQQQLWSTACQTEVANPEPATAIRAYREFLAAKPPATFAALAQYSLGLLLAKAGDREASRSCFESVWNHFPGATGQSGLPLKPLAGLKLLELNSAGTNPELLSSVCSNVVWNPTPLSSEILDRAAERAATLEARTFAGQWEQTWIEHERARELFGAAEARGPELRPGVGAVRAFWVFLPEALPSQSSRADSPARSHHLQQIKAPHVSPSRPIMAGLEERDQNWLALRADQGASNSWFICRAQTDIGACLTSIIAASRQIPEYFGVAMDVAGRRLTWPAPDLREWEYQNYFGREGGGQKKVLLEKTSTNLLASAALPSDPGLLKLSVYLTSRSALLARERTRSFWLLALVSTAALAAGLGFVKAYRAFWRQLRLNELKSNFVSSVSHELRAPIASVRLMAESLERGKIAEAGKQREYFKFIVQECRRLSSLVENVLDFSRIEQGRKQYDFEPTDVVALTKQTVKLLEPYAAERQVALQLRVLSDHLQLNADGKALQQALVNLIDNAIKHSPKGQTVTVGLERGTGAPPVTSEPLGSGLPDGAAVSLWVEDRGEGIPPGEHEKIFERFYRRGSELRRETQGVGIGLSIVKHIVEAHGGRVELRSEVGEGSRFTIVLPAGINTGPLSETGDSGPQNTRRTQNWDC